ncbi:MAG: phosphate-starvation-inducible PsiE family protein [Geodermatophilaceae bacterium]|nr:phosphate-starvation-inducible PsiE family protein [Geodermatophilaceae bacterium]
MSSDEQQEEERQRTADRVLSIIEDVIYWAIAVVLVAGALVLLWVQIYAFTKLADEGSETVLVEILDGLLLVFIFVELLFAVRATLRSHEIVAEPFLIVGIIVCIKEIVVLSVQSAKLLSDGPEFARAITEVGILGGLVLLLSIAMYVLRLRREEAADDVAEEAADAADEADEAERSLEQAGREREQAGKTRAAAGKREGQS